MKNVKLIILALAAFVVTSNVWGARSFVAITNTSELSTGDSVIIAIQDGADNSKWWAMEEYTSNNLQGTNSVVTVSSNTITDPAKSLTWAVTKNTDGTFVFKSPKGYYVYSSGSNTTVSTTGTTSANWYITQKSGIYFKLQVTNNSGRYMCANNDTPSKMASYTWSDNTMVAQVTDSKAVCQYAYEISIFRKSTKPSLSLNLSYTSTTLTAGGANSSSPTLTGNSGSGTVTYSLESVSPAGCATINVSTGVVSPVAQGTATAKASVAETAQYQSGTATCNFTINAAPTNHTISWKVDGETYTAGSPTTQVAHGGKVSTLPTAPATPASCGTAVFMGWTDHEVTNGSVPSPLFKTAADAPVVNADVTYHAVFADED